MAFCMIKKAMFYGSHNPDSENLYFSLWANKTKTRPKCRAGGWGEWLVGLRFTDLFTQWGFPPGSSHFWTFQRESRVQIPSMRNSTHNTASWVVLFYYILAGAREEGAMSPFYGIVLLTICTVKRITSDIGLCTLSNTVWAIWWGS